MSSRKKWELDRRTFLKGLGVSIGLPFLEAMVPSVAQAANGRTQRLVWIYMPLGSGVRDYQESGLYAHPTILSNAISSIRADTSVITNLSVFANAHWPGGPTGNAHPNAFVPFINAGNWATVATMSKTWDQHIADLNVGTKVKAISMTPQFWAVGDIPDLQANTLSYTGPNQPVPVSQDPKVLFNSLFSGGTQTQIDTRVQDQLRRKKSILDYVMGDIQKVNAKVGKDDKVRLDEYLTGISDLEKNISASLGSQPTQMACQVPALADPTNYPTKIKYFYDIIFYAFQCDLTRVASMMHGIEGGTGINHQAFIPGMSTGSDWHGLSHWRTPDYQGSSTNIETNYSDLSRVINFHQAQVVNFVTRLRDTALPTGGRLLDECAVVWGSAISDSTSHDPRGLVMHVAGTANGALRRGTTINANNQHTMANFYLTLMQAFGSTATRHGVSTGTLTNLRV